MFWIKLPPSTVQVTDPASECDQNTEGYNER